MMGLDGRLREVRLYVISHASVLNRVYNFVRVCSNYKQGIGCAIG